MIVLFIVVLVAILFICVLLLTSMRNDDGNKKRGVRMLSSKKKSKYALEIEFENEEVKNTLLIAMRDAYGNVETSEDTSLRIDKWRVGFMRRANFLGDRRFLDLVVH